MSETEVKTTTLDYIDEIVVEGEVFREPSNEYWSLICFWKGMEFLYAQIARAEAVIRDKLEAGDQVFSFVEEPLDPAGVSISSGNPIISHNISVPLVTSAFVWYSISACQFVRLVGAIAYRLDDSKPLPPAYVKSVIPEVLAYRDKVGAHLAWSTQNQRDNDAERLASVLPQLDYSQLRLRAAAMQVTLQQGNEVSNSGAIQPWSLTEIHERLATRYLPPPALQESSRSDPANGDQDIAP